MVDFRELTLKSLVIAFVAVVLIDLTVHFFFSSPFETISYFGFKFLVAFTIAFIGYSFFEKSLQNMVIGALIFTSIFHLIYSDALIGGYLDLNRATEVFGVTGFFEIGTIFYLIHGIGFYIGLLIAKEI